ncbi:hypothetical protein CGQ47_04005 [Listeria monocytogenes]|nr:hypothetical protein [Listeria monocytogenes]EAF1311683.1 hypothetical protein [Listeria monocytogenes]
MRHFDYNVEEYKKGLTDDYLVSLLLEQGYEVEENALLAYYKKKIDDLNKDFILDDKTYYLNENKSSKFKVNKNLYSSIIKNEKINNYPKTSEAA